MSAPRDSAAGGPELRTVDIPSLDGIRAASFLVVFLAHAGLYESVPGGFGVTVFFFLSGFLITTLMRVEVDRHGRASFAEFYLRRAFRILPPFYLVLSLAVIASRLAIIPGSVSGHAIAAQCLHLANYWIVLHGYGGQPDGTGVYWSLAVEEHFYLLFPWLYVGLRRLVPDRRAQAAVLLAACGVVLAWRCVLVYGLGSSTDRTYVASDTRVDSILFGCALAVFGNPALDGPSRIDERVWKWLLLPLGALALLFAFAYRAPGFRETLRYTLQGLALYPLFVVAVRFPSWGPFRLLGHPWAVRLGVYSYGAYLVHHVVLEAVAFHLPAGPIVRGCVALGLTVALAAALHRLVESPCTELRKRVVKALRARSSAASWPKRPAPTGVVP